MTKNSKPEKQAKQHAKGASPRSGMVPPIENRWKKGQSGNPGGRPKGSVNLTSRLRTALSKNDGQLAEVIVKVLIREAAKGKFNHLHEILDRIDGKVVQQVQLNATIQETQRQFMEAAERVLDERSLSALLSELARTRDRAAIASESSVH